ncbi:MAG: hypothetical protein EXS08_10990 [Planctomycetes bacterium]|nr:hypothetical protein [Planctomycetota bacterium]
MALFVLASAACKGPGGSRPAPQTHLERSFFFAERDRHGGEHAISAKHAQNEGGVERIADGATLDVNSQLQVRIEDALAAPDRPGLIVSPGAAAALSADARELARALSNLGELRELEAQALQAWQRYEADPGADEDSATYQDFDRLRKKLSAAELAILDPIRRLWPMAERTAIDDDKALAMLNGEPRAQQEFAEHLQARLDELSRRGEEFERGVRTRGEADQRRLRIEAFLVPAAGKDKGHAVHVPGYDDLDQGEIQRIDPLGLRLTKVEREALEEVMASSKELARALERVRSGELTLAQAFEQSSGPLFEGLSRLLRDLEQLDLQALEKRIQRTRDAAKELVKQLETAAQALAQAKREEWNGKLEAFLEHSKPLQELLAQVEALQSLRDDWKHFDVGQLPELVMRTLDALEKLREAWDEREQFVDEAGTLLTTLHADIAGLKGEARTQAEALWAKSKLKGELEEWRDLVARIRALLERLIGLSLAHKPARTHLQNPQAIDLPIGEARDTAIDLRRTTRKAGDTLQVRARLLAPGSDDKDAEPPLEATFELEKLGWHADLVPSVVFVEGDTVAGSGDGGGFSTALNWLWSYGPRDDDGDRHLSRSLDWGVGLHAVFLNFGPDHDAEVGLGITGGIWNQRLQFGAGYNPLADSAEDGRFYYFVGSSLIPLLQALTRDD